ncbi:MAG: hypothetical protein ACRYG2_19840, partial [Janthinobacterium lividum]
GPGRPIAYTLTLANSGQTDYTGAEVDQALGSVLDEASYNQDATASSGRVALDGTTLRWVGDVAQGQTVTVTFSASVNAPALGDRVLVNTASSDVVGSTCPTGTALARCSTTVQVLVPELTTAITADRTTTTPGSTVTYTVTLANTGQTDAPGAVVDVLLGGVLDDAGYDGDAVTSSGTLSYSAPRLTWTGDLLVGASATFTFSATVSRPPTGDRSLGAALDTHVPGSSCDNGTGTAGCTSTVAVLLPGLAVSTVANAASATPGDAVRFTVTVTNSGQTAYPGATVTTALADVVDDATVTGTPAASTGVVRLVGSDLVWTGSLPLGASATITATVTVNPAAQLGNRQLSATSVSDDTGSSCPSTGSDTACVATVAVLVPSLAIRTSPDRTTTTPSAVVTYTTTITNDGETAQTGVSVSTSLSGLVSEAVYDGDATVSGGGVLAYDAPVLTWTGSLPVGASATVRFSVTVNNPVTGDRELSTSVTSAAAGSSCPAGSTAADCSTYVQVLVPALQITKTASTSTAVAGSAVQYTVTVVNTGQTAYAPATFRDDLSLVLDDATYDGGATATSGTLGYANHTLVWSGPLELGARAVITYSVVTAFPAVGDHTMRDTVVSDSTGANCVAGSTRTRCRSEVTVLVPALTIAKTASSTSVVAGGILSYTISATNSGQADYPSAALADDLAGVLDDGAYNGDATASGGTVDYGAGTLRWAGPLARGATVVITYSVTVAPADRGDRRLVNAVVSPTVGSTCPDGGGTAACTVTTAVDADVLTLSGLTSSFRLTGLPGDTVEQEEAVTMTVTTNSADGYTVSVRPTEASLHATGTADTIPVGQVSVRPSGEHGAQFVPLDPSRSTQVHNQDRASAPGGDAVGSDYRVQIPFVDSGDYGTTVEYVVTAQ